MVLSIRHVAKSHKATPFGSKGPLSNTLHFKAIFDSSLKNLVKRALVPGEKCTTKNWSFFSAGKNLLAPKFFRLIRYILSQ